MYLSEADIKELLTIGNESCVILFEYYLKKAGIANFEYTDTKAANSLGYSERKVRDTRLLLTKLGWFKQKIIKQKKEQAIFTYLGKKSVEEANSHTTEVVTKLSVEERRAKYKEAVENSNYSQAYKDKMLQKLEDTLGLD